MKAGRERGYISKLLVSFCTEKYLWMFIFGVWMELFALIFGLKLFCPDYSVQSVLSVFVNPAAHYLLTL